jgi:carbonic anhydrase
MADKNDTDEKTEPSRRSFLTSLAIVGGGVVGGGLVGKKVLGGASDATATSVRPKTHDEILKALIDGNQRFSSGASVHPNLDATVRAAQAEKQTPWAAVLTCADSRVGPELIFDQGIGDFFVARVAGNIASPDVVASLAYAVEHLGVTAIVVLGHESCGAVKATIETMEKQSDPGEFKALIDAIRPAVTLDEERDAAEVLHESVEKNVHLVTKALPEVSAIVAERFYADELIIQPAVYNVTTGFVAML